LCCRRRVDCSGAFSHSLWPFAIRPDLSPPCAGGDTQGCGLGERLLVAAFDAAGRAGCECVTLLVRETNTNAGRLSARLGFAERAISLGLIGDQLSTLRSQLRAALSDRLSAIGYLP
jgi:Acetyltransferase (GNAT) family